MSDFLLEKRFLMLLCGAKVIKYAVAPIFLICVLHEGFQIMQRCKKDQ